MNEQEFREHIVTMVEMTCGSASALARKHNVHPKALTLFLSGARGASPELAAAFGFRREYAPLVTPKPALAKPRPDREAVARIIDPTAFADAARYPLGTRDHAIAVAKANGALAKGDAILALLPAEPVQEMREGAVHKTAGGSICISHGGKMICLPAADWVALAGPSEDGWREERERLRAALEKIGRAYGEWSPDARFASGVLAEVSEQARAALSEPKVKEDRE